MMTAFVPVSDLDSHRSTGGVVPSAATTSEGRDDNAITAPRDRLPGVSTGGVDLSSRRGSSRRSGMVRRRPISACLQHAFAEGPPRRYSCCPNTFGRMEVAKELLHDHASRSRNPSSDERLDLRSANHVAAANGVLSALPRHRCGAAIPGDITDDLQDLVQRRQHGETAPGPAQRRATS